MAKTSETIDPSRRLFVGGMGTVIAAAGLGLGRPALAASPTLSAFGSLKQVDAGVLRVSYAEQGPADGPVVVLLHGWPYDIHTYVDVAPLLAAKGYRVIVPSLRGYGETRFLSAETPRNGQQGALAVDVIALMDALKLDKVLLGGCDWGARTACIVAALWPERVKGLVSVSGYLIGSQKLNEAPLPPKAEQQWWYQFYFATERGAAGYARNTRDFARLIWETASPKWTFDDATFARSAAAFDNPDHVAISIHNYRWRLGLAQGEAQLDALESKLSAFPVITVPSFTLEGDANGAPHPDPSTYARKSPAGIGIGRSTAASATTCRRRLRPLSPKPSSRSVAPEATPHMTARDGYPSRSDMPTNVRGSRGPALPLLPMIPNDLWRS